MGNANLFYAESTCPDEFYLGPWKVKLGLKLGEVAVLWTLAASQPWPARTLQARPSVSSVTARWNLGLEWYLHQRLHSRSSLHLPHHRL